MANQAPRYDPIGILEPIGAGSGGIGQASAVEASVQFLWQVCNPRTCLVAAAAEGLRILCSCAQMKSSLSLTAALGSYSVPLRYARLDSLNSAKGR